MMTHEIGEKQQLDREIRDMMSTLTRRLAHLHKKPTEGEDEESFGIITMAGSNEGATISMRGDLFENEERYLNSNFQGVNNSIMVGGSYAANDPGIHMDVDDSHQGKRGKKGKKKAYSGSSTSDHSS